MAVLWWLPSLSGLVQLWPSQSSGQSMVSHGYWVFIGAICHSLCPSQSLPSAESCPGSPKPFPSSNRIIEWPFLFLREGQKVTTFGYKFGLDFSFNSCLFGYVVLCCVSQDTRKIMNIYTTCICTFFFFFFWQKLYLADATVIADLFCDALLPLYSWLHRALILP